MSNMPSSCRVSIALAAYNVLDHTRLCLQSIFQFTPQPYELILVDNGSRDGTGEFFDSIKADRVIHNDENLGFAKSYNQCLRSSTGHYIIIINNDCVVSYNWLENMLACAQKDTAVGLVGPRGNNINGRQRMERNFVDLDDYYNFTRSFNKRDPGKWFEVSTLVGFCLLLKREVIQRVGFFDERYGLGTHEDIDYSIRARLAGFKLFCAGDVFIHHFSHRTFFVNQIDLQGLYRRNKAIFREKWNIY